MSKMKLFYVKGTCSLNPRIVINEIGLDVEFIKVDPADKTTQDDEDYLSINPKGSVPALMLQNGEILTEGAIITQYLADSTKSYNLLPELGNFKRFRVLEMVNHIATDIHKSCSPIFNRNVPNEIKDSVFKPILLQKLTGINAILLNSHYLTGDEFTIADSYLFVVLSWMGRLQIDISSFAGIQNFIANSSKRNSIVKSLNDELNN
jgi:glutathione S-transferase